MLKRILLLSCTLVLIGSSASWAQTRIHSIPYTIQDSGTYDIDTDLVSTGSGIIVRADNVTIDLNGFSIIGSGTGNGIDVGLSKNVEVRNGTITNFNNGAWSDDGTLRTKIIHMRIVDNAATGVLLSIGCVIKGSVISGNGGSGISAQACTVQGNSVSDNGGDGIGALSSLVIDNTSYDNTRSGIQGQASTVKNNVATGNATGISLSGNCVVDGNTAVGNTTSNMSSCSTCAFGINVAP